MMKRIVVSILLFCVFLVGCSNQQNNYTSNLVEFEKRYAENKTDKEYSKYIEFDVKKPLVKKESDGSDMDAVSYDINFKNVSNEDVKFGVKVYLSKIMTDKYILNQSPLDDCGSTSEVTLKPGEGYHIEAERLILPTDNLSKNEQKIYDQNIGSFYLEIHINGKVYYELASI